MFNYCHNSNQCNASNYAIPNVAEVQIMLEILVHHRGCYEPLKLIRCRANVTRPLVRLALQEQQQSAPCPDGPLAKGPHQRRGPAPPAWASGPATRRPPATQWPPPLKYRGERFYYNDGGTTLRVFRGGPIPVLPSRCRHLGRKPGRDGRKPRRPVPPPSGERVCPTGDRTTLSTPS